MVYVLYNHVYNQHKLLVKRQYYGIVHMDMSYNHQLVLGLLMFLLYFDELMVVVDQHLNLILVVVGLVLEVLVLLDLKLVVLVL
eukprot:UN03824